MARALVLPLDAGGFVALLRLEQPCPRSSFVNGPIDLHVVVQGTGPLILCVHGYPELSYSWRHQIDHFSTRGYTVSALDVRGYGESSKPSEVAGTRCAN